MQKSSNLARTGGRAMTQEVSNRPSSSSLLSLLLLLLVVAVVCKNTFQGCRSQSEPGTVKTNLKSEQTDQPLALGTRPTLQKPGKVQVAGTLWMKYGDLASDGTADGLMDPPKPQ